MKVRMVWMMLALLMVCVMPARADNLYPPDYAGDPLSYEAHWDFVTPPPFSPGVPPDSEAATPGTAGETLYNGFSTHIDFSGNWLWDGVSLIYPDAEGGSMGVNVVNWVDEMPFKEVRVQIYWSGQVAPLIVGVLGVDNGGQVGGGQTGGANYPGVIVEDWVILPNPDWEQIQIDVPAGTMIDQIDVHTVSSPEPASLMLLGAGALLLVGRRHR